MRQVSPFVPGPERRAAVDERIAVFSALDRQGGSPSYIVDRDDRAYIQALYGVDHFFSHIRSLTSKFGSPVICDIGTGKGIALKGFKNREQAKGINFIGTNLTDSNKEIVEENIGKGNVYVTTAEELSLGERGAESIHGFMGVYSLTQSGDLPTVAKNMDYYLAPGGAIKIITYSDNGGTEEFTKTLQELGYSVAVTNRGFRKVRRLLGLNYTDTILAIKPDPSRELPTAEELMRKDATDFENGSYGI